MLSRNAMRHGFARLLLVALPALSPLFGSAARADKDWPPIPPEQLSLATPSVDRDADAEALLWEVKVDDKLEEDGLLSIRDHFLRVKVFTQKGAQEWSKHEIDYPREGVSLSDIAARTTRPNGSVLVMDRKAISHEIMVKTSRGALKRTSFALPGVEPGCIVEYRYREYRRDEDAYASSYPFQLHIPVQKVVYKIRPLSVEGMFMRQLTFHVAAESSPTTVSGFYETRATNMPAFVTEPDMPPEGQQLAFMALFYTVGQKTTADTYWPEVGKTRAERFDRETKPDDRMREAVRALVAGATTDREKVGRIASWMKTSFMVVRSSSPDSLKARGLRATSDAREAWRQNGGRYRDGLLVFASLARAAGLDVRWMMVPTRSELFFNRNMLNEGFLNSYQVAVRLDGRWESFDPLARYLPWDMRPWDEEATMGLLCDRDSSRFVETSYSGPERTVRTRSVDLALEPDGTLEGTVRVLWTGHWNDYVRDLLADYSADEHDSLATDLQSDGDEGAKLTSASFTLETGGSSPLRMSAKVRIPGFATVTGKRILLEPAVFHAHAQPRYPNSARRHPVYYRYPWTEVDSVRIRLPQGWKVESADDVEPVGAAGVSDYAAAVSVNDEAGEVVYVRRFRMGLNGSIYFEPKYYAGVKKLFDGIHKRDGVSLTLTRTDAGP